MTITMVQFRSRIFFSNYNILPSSTTRSRLGYYQHSSSSSADTVSFISLHISSIGLKYDSFATSFFHFINSHGLNNRMPQFSFRHKFFKDVDVHFSSSQSDVQPPALPRMIPGVTCPPLLPTDDSYARLLPVRSQPPRFSGCRVPYTPQLNPLPHS